ncbi:MAG: hypothetical protein GQ529_04295 [Methyloprofundus sp.]|nr:hypothetical protein [Methyloprofundus sp.]
MFEIVIVIAIALAVWLFVHFRKKKHESAAETTIAQKVPTESKGESEPKPAVSVETAEVGGNIDVVPEDSALRRHYLQNLAALNDTASVVEVDVVEDEVVAEVFVTEESDNLELVSNNPVSGIPEDSALKRHFIQKLVAEAEDTMPARPTDSALKRHYDAQLMSVVNSQLQALK